MSGAAARTGKEISKKIRKAIVKVDNGVGKNK